MYRRSQLNLVIKTFTGHLRRQRVCLTTPYNHQLLGSEGATLFKRLTLGDKGGCNPVISSLCLPRPRGGHSQYSQDGLWGQSLLCNSQQSCLLWKHFIGQDLSMKDSLIILIVNFFLMLESFKTTFPESDDVGSLSVCPWPRSPLSLPQPLISILSSPPSGVLSCKIYYYQNLERKWKDTSHKIQNNWTKNHPKKLTIF